MLDFRPEVISFDAAGTLIDVNWNPAQIAVESALVTGVPLGDPLVAGEAYGRLLRSRWGHFQELNLQRNEAICDAFWLEIGKDWLESLGIEPALAQGVYDHAMDRMFSPGSDIFSLFEDSIPTLEALQAAGFRIAIISNWDVSLHRTCRMLGLTKYCSIIVASLEEGVEKPDPLLFELTFERLSVHPRNVVHVGDDPVADVQGARNVGAKPFLIDRSIEVSEAHRLADLRDLLPYLGLPR